MFTICELTNGMLNTVDEVIDALGGPRKTAEVASVGKSAVSNWSKRGRISQDCFVLIRNALAALDKEASPTVFGFKESVEARP
jgi:CI repressor-like protein